MISSIPNINNIQLYDLYYLFLFNDNHLFAHSYMVSSKNPLEIIIGLINYF